MLEFVLAAPLNHVLRAAPWALTKLKPHAGKSARFDLGLVRLRYAVTEAGELRPAASSGETDARFELSPALLLRAVQDREALAEARVSGDTEFAADLAYVAKHLDWDVEEDLSKLFGDIVAHRIAGGARELNAWRANVQASFLDALKDYWTEERPLVVKRSRVDQFVRQVDELRDAVERLDKRLQKLAAGRGH